MKKFLFLLSALFVGLLALLLVKSINGATKIEGVVVQKTPEELYDETLLDRKSKSPKEISFDTDNVSSGDFDISAKHAIAVNLSNSKILFSKDVHERVPVASLVKVMTAVVALEHASPDYVINISPKASSMEPNDMGISAGEKYTLEELLYGLVLNSGNDASVAIAEGIAGSEENFTIWMNLKAKELGLKDTKFVDPNGLNLNDETWYSSAYDLAVISKYALDNFPLLREIFSTYQYEIQKADSHKYIYLENLTNLISTYPGAKGIKIGYTPEAGNTLITYAENGDAKILGVILDAVNQRYDAILLLDYCFAKEGVTVKHNLL